MYTLAYILAFVIVFAGCSGAPGNDDDDNGDPSCSLLPLPFNDALSQTGATRDVHDPVLVKSNNRYFLFSTGHGVPIRESDDLITWSGPSQVFSAMPPWIDVAIPGVEFPWAPDISFFNGRYHLYYSLSGFGSQRSIIALATNTTLDSSDPAYEWTDLGKVVESIPNGTDFNAIDPNVAFDDSGTPWLTWGSWWDGIKMRQLESGTGLFSPVDETIHSLARRPVEHAIEAAFIIKRGVYFYLFVSFDNCCQGSESTYKVMVGRSSAITGPYVDRSATPMTEGGGTAVLKGYGRIRGPGHNAVYEENGKFYLVHHFYDALAGGVPKLQIRSMLWDQDGWPLAGEPFDGDFPTEPPDATPIVMGKWAHSVDSGTPYEIELKDGGVLERCKGEGSWLQEGRSLILNWTIGGNSEERLQLASNGSWYVGRTTDGRLIRGSKIIGN